MTNLVLLNTQRDKKAEQDRADLINGLKELLARAELGELKAVCYASIAVDGESITLGIRNGRSIADPGGRPSRVGQKLDLRAHHSLRR